MVYGQEDIDYMAVDSGVPVAIDGVAGYGWVDRASMDVVEGEATSVTDRDILLRVSTASFPTLRVGSAVVVEGASYEAHDIEKPGDGALSFVRCARS